MSLHFSFFEVILLVGIIQGFIMAILVWTKKIKTTSKLLLSLLLTVFNLLCIKILLFTTGLWQTSFFRYFPLALDLSIQPLSWLYISSLVKPGFRLQKKDGLHFLPFILSLVYSVFIYLAVLPETIPAAKDNIANHFYFKEIKEIEDFLSIISAVVYWAMGLKLLLRYRKWVYNQVSNTDYPTYAWLKNVAVLMGVLIAGLTIAIILDHVFDFGRDHFLHWQLFFIYLAALIYYLGFRGVQLPDKKITNESPTETPEFTSIQKEKKLPDEKSRQVEEAIRKALETDQLYLDPELNLQKLSKHVNSSPAIVSAVINTNFQKSFRHLVNEYRVQKVKQRLADPRAKQLSLLGIAYESGFNSEASFYRIFKSVEGISPKEYMNRLEKQ